MLSELWELLPSWLLLLLAGIHYTLVAAFMVWVLMTKTEATSAVAWLLVLAFLPVFGILFFLMFGYQHVTRRLRKKRRHRERYQAPPDPAGYAEAKQWHLPGEPRTEPRGIKTLGESLSELGRLFGGSAVTQGNQVDFYHDGLGAFAAMFEAIAAAKHHIHVQTFILHADELGAKMLDALVARARAGIEVRLLYDAIGSYRVPGRFLEPLRAAGGKAEVFLPIAPFRRRLQVNLRNHRKITIVDGTTGFVGGLNIGDEYIGKNRYFGYWRDTHLRLRGPGVVDLQRVFAEDWDFASGEYLDDESKYFHANPGQGPYPIQILDAGPDQDVKAIREVIFAAILKARRRLWIASPYFVPDSALLDALRLAAFSGVDVRFLGQLKPDKWIPQFAARYYWAQVLGAGVRVYQYKRGMMHAKVILIDDEFASVGTANLDNRSMFLNFEVNCLVYSPEAVRELEAQFERDFAESAEIDPERFAQRPVASRLIENACRLLSPVL
jgi:cardiolipin synthase